MNQKIYIPEGKRLVVVSNRLPIVIARKAGKPTLQAASGGLITALAPLLRSNGGLWIGWPGTSDFSEQEVSAITADFQKQEGFSLAPVPLSKGEVEGYYDGFSNEIIWPLFHDLHSQCKFLPSYWEEYHRVNEKFADIIHQQTSETDFIWVNDYHLMLAARKLRKLGIESKLAFFLHIPFAPPDIFMKIPWRFEILRGLLSYSFVGFQTPRDQRNFCACIDKLLPEARIEGKENSTYLNFEGLKTHVGTYPISIDFDEFANTAVSIACQTEINKIRKPFPDRKIIFSVDRLDYTKGIPYRLDAIRQFLHSYPEYHGKVNFIQIVVPSRTDIPDYHAMKKTIDRIVSDINGEFTTPGWIPVHHIFHSVSRIELVAYYRTSDVMLVHSVKDGMNLVAKEYVASNVDESGVLVLSEFTGAACQLREGAILVNPYDTVAGANAIKEALIMKEDERQRRMQILRKEVQKNDIYQWISSIFTATEDLQEEALPISEYIPVEEEKNCNHSA